MPSIVVTPKYNPFTFDELYRPLAETTKMQMALEDQYNAMEMEAAKLDYLEKSDPKAYEIVKNYENTLRGLAGELASNGLTPQSRQGVYDMRRLYSSDIDPINKYVAWKNDQAKSRQAIRDKDNTYMWETPLEKIQYNVWKDNPNMVLQGASGEALTKSVSEQVKHLAKRFQEDPSGLQISNLGDAAKYLNGLIGVLQSYGASRDQILAYMEDNNLTEEQRRKLLETIEPLFDMAIDNTKKSFGIDKWSNQEDIQDWFNGSVNAGLWSAIGVDQYGIHNSPNYGKGGKGGKVTINKSPLSYREELFQFMEDEALKQIQDNKDHYSGILDAVTTYNNTDTKTPQQSLDIKNSEYEVATLLPGFLKALETEDENIINQYFNELVAYGGTAFPVLDNIGTTGPLDDGSLGNINDTNDKLQKVEDDEDSIDALIKKYENIGKNLEHMYDKAERDVTNIEVPGLTYTWNEVEDIENIEVPEYKKEDVEKFKEYYEKWKNTNNHAGDAAIFGSIRVAFEQPELKEVWNESISGGNGATTVSRVVSNSDAERASIELKDGKRLDKDDLNIKEGDRLYMDFGDYGCIITKESENGDIITIRPELGSNYQKAFDALNEAKKAARKVYLNTKNPDDKATAKTTMENADHAMQRVIVLSQQKMKPKTQEVQNIVEIE